MKPDDIENVVIAVCGNKVIINFLFIIALTHQR